ncbi:hypothetical protein A2839_00200 [Candidatus Uhrbacteria bacterium RIFCSPHIGHO2_01_FULL_47_10]|nr:MAG: hypothetical protein A2839_00200 [Candidatus Uhrbacteria bacterium RIFCSPHIGHO2_01_FULL_47_10]
MPRKRRILIVDSDLSLHETWKVEMGNRFHVESALSLEDAQIALDEKPTFALIAVESFQDGKSLNAVPFIQRIRQTFRKPIIGIAPDYPRQLQMIQAGCTVFAERRNLPDRIFEALALL